MKLFFILLLAILLTGCQSSIPAYKAAPVWPVEFKRGVEVDSTIAAATKVAPATNPAPKTVTAPAALTNSTVPISQTNAAEAEPLNFVQPNPLTQNSTPTASQGKDFTSTNTIKPILNKNVKIYSSKGNLLALLVGYAIMFLIALIFLKFQKIKLKSIKVFQFVKSRFSKFHFPKENPFQANHEAPVQKEAAQDVVVKQTLVAPVSIQANPPAKPIVIQARKD